MLRNKKYLIATIWLLATTILFISFVIDSAKRKQQFTKNIQQEIAAYMQQQTYSLQRLANNLIVPLRNQDFKIIAANLTAYEEITFSLAKHDLAIPTSIHVVSLNAPQFMVNSAGLAKSIDLAPDGEYYARVVEDPHELAVSHSYIKQEMPDYPMLNYGLGILDNLNNYYGQLDVKIAVAALHDYIRIRVDDNEYIFDFEVNTNNVLQPLVKIRQAQYLVACIAYICIRILVLFALASVVYLFMRIYNKYSALQQTIEQQDASLSQTKEQLRINLAAQKVQDAYGSIPKNAAKQNIYMQQILDDIKAVNAQLAVAGGVTLHFPVYNNANILFYGNKLRIMQILSGILYEMILQLHGGGSITIEVTITDKQNGKQNIEFCFRDNGFYDKLQERVVVQSSADVRCQGWQHIAALIAQQDGTLEYRHTAYAGNTIRFTLERQIINNVVSLGMAH